MNFKLRNTTAAVLGLALQMVHAGSAQAAMIALTGATGSSCTYTSYSATSSGDLAVVCNTGSTPTVPSCMLSASPSTINSGGASTLTATCSPVATSYKWTGTGTEVFTGSTSAGNVSPTSTTTYTVTGTNGSGFGNTAQNTVTVGSASSTPIPGNVPANCKIVDVTWAAGFKYGVTPWQNLPSGQMVAFRMTVPANKRISQAGTGYADVPELLSISTGACDFSAVLAKNNCMAGGDNDPSMWNGPGTVAGAYCNTPAGSVIYYNVKHATSPDGADTCPAGKICKFSLWW